VLFASLCCDVIDERVQFGKQRMGRNAWAWVIATGGNGFTDGPEVDNRVAGGKRHNGSKSAKKVRAKRYFNLEPRPPQMGNKDSCAISDFFDSLSIRWIKHSPTGS